MSFKNEYQILAIIVLITSGLLSAVIEIPGDYSEIQQGIDASSDGDTVLVSPGEYYENIVFHGREIVLGSLFIATGDTNYISQTIINGNSSGSVVTFTDNETSQTELTGFTITNGSGTWESVLGTSYHFFGGGILVWYASPTLHHLKIENNTAWKGGGMALVYSDSDLNFVSIHDNEVSGSDDTYGGGLYAYTCTGQIKNSSIIDNYSYLNSGGVYLRLCSILMSDCRVIRNIAAGVAGGISISEGEAIIEQSLIFDNSADWGGGILIWGLVDVYLRNVTVAENSALDGGGIWLGNGATATLVNGIIWNNSLSEIWFRDYNDSNGITISYSDIDGGVDAVETNENGYLNWNEGNISENPAFVDPYTGNFHLTELSPCIDAGFPQIHPDPDGTITDMGAFYFDQNQNCMTPGDLNSDGYIDILDIIEVVLCIMNDLENCPCADTDNSGEYNILDIIIIVNWIMET